MSRKELFWLIVIILAFIIAPQSMAALVASILHAISVLIHTMNLH
jgi:type IV secretory pathway VirB3-like protein